MLCCKFLRRIYSKSRIYSLKGVYPELRFYDFVSCLNMSYLRTIVEPLAWCVARISISAI